MRNPGNAYVRRPDRGRQSPVVGEEKTVLDRADLIGQRRLPFVALHRRFA
jgi:hypothetical protein